MKGGAWYLVARNRGRIGTYRAAAIRTLAVADVTFERPPDFDLAMAWRAQLADFGERLRPLRATLRASFEGRRKLAELGDFAAAAVRAADGGKIDLPIETIDQAAALVLGLAGEVEALAPPELRARIAELAAAAVVRHASAE